MLIKSTVIILCLCNAANKRNETKRNEDYCKYEFTGDHQEAIPYEKPRCE